MPTNEEYAVKSAAKAVRVHSGCKSVGPGRNISPSLSIFGVTVLTSKSDVELENIAREVRKAMVKWTIENTQCCE